MSKAVSTIETNLSTNRKTNRHSNAPSTKRSPKNLSKTTKNANPNTTFSGKWDPSPLKTRPLELEPKEYFSSRTATSTFMNLIRQSDYVTNNLMKIKHYDSKPSKKVNLEKNELQKKTDIFNKNDKITGSKILSEFKKQKILELQYKAGHLYSNLKDYTTVQYLFE